jgi:glycogen debranching enzyme
MEEVIRIKDQFYILANSSMAEETTRVLKHADTFLLTDRHGDIRPLGFEEHGLFHQGTRFISRFVLRLEDKSPLLLSSTIEENNCFLVVDLTNPDLNSEGGTRIPKGTIHINRTGFVYEGCFYERVRAFNYGTDPVETWFSFEYDADFADIFEVRGMKRKQRGDFLEPVLESGRKVLAYELPDRKQCGPSQQVVESNRLVLIYRGLDGVLRKSRMEFSPKPSDIGRDRAVFPVRLDPHQQAEFYITVSCESEPAPVAVRTYDQAFQDVRKMNQRRSGMFCIVETSNEQFNDWLNRSMADVHMMLTRTEHGPYPYAGIPWFNTVFGRDGIITALSILWLYPDASRGVLGYLAARQAEAVEPERDAEPGKILHEERTGEMAALKEIPFGLYYGSVDSTPLFVILAGYYFELTGDLVFIRQLWPNIERAIEWIDKYGDVDSDGFVEYMHHMEGGLTNQGWKDSKDSVFHADGTMAEPPIALCEVQGYVYEAKLKGARMALALGENETSERLTEEAGILRKRFHDAFWCEDLGTYAIALDGKKQPCRVRTSNAGHCLFSGIASEEHAKRISENLMSEPFFSGWGIRTLASSEARYNPMAYHNGSVWPHDNAIVGLGLSRYGFKDEAMRVLTGLFDASIFLDLHRLPELFCGFERQRGAGPTLYPVACDPQAWASGAVFLLLQTCLGLSVGAKEKKVCFDHPALPPFLQEVTIKNLKVGSASIDLRLGRHEADVTVHVIRRKGDVEVDITK